MLFRQVMIYDLGIAIFTDRSCGWGDAVILVPLAVYQACGDKRILEDDYDAMTRWMKYIEDRVTNHHPKE